MSSDKNSANNFAIRQIVSNSCRSYLRYYFAFLILLSVIIILDFLVYYYLLQVQKEKQEAFIEGSCSSISNLIIKDLTLIFDQSQDLNKLLILKNYSEIKKIDRNYNIVGNVIYVNRGNKTIIFDLQPFASLINSILTKDFYYKITLNNHALLSNVEDREFFYTKNYQINLENFLVIKLAYKPTSLYLDKYYTIFKQQLLIIISISTLVFLLLIPPLYYLISKKQQLKKLHDEISLINKAFELNINYVKNCQKLEQYDFLPIQLTVIKNTINQIDLEALIEEIKIYALAYTARFRYKFELNLISEVDSIRINFEPIILKQIIISLFHNILYFMRGGEHVKKFLVKFKEDRIVFIYDSFAANEEHMQNWSRGLFQHLTNPYILDCQKIFQSIKDCNL
ncbi:MAG: hypothetical protein NWP91_03685, partial [Rickettsiaceae bacterium]|nr:hypothetical protein [Rickettsiaceae bacterium]